MKRQIRLLTALSLACSAAIAAADTSDSAYFGRIDLRQAPRPDVINAKPVHQAHGPAGFAGAPIYLHVRPGQELRWGAHCHAYKACDAQVYFVSETWYREVYLPRVGGAAGREQKYRDHVRMERNERNNRHRHDHQ
jgi:hypothetical protein